jgi:hypothetical protein
MPNSLHSDFFSTIIMLSALVFRKLDLKLVRYLFIETISVYQYPHGILAADVTAAFFPSEDCAAAE